MFTPSGSLKLSNASSTYPGGGNVSVLDPETCPWITNPFLSAILLCVPLQTDSRLPWLSSSSNAPRTLGELTDLSTILSNSPSKTSSKTIMTCVRESLISLPRSAETSPFSRLLPSRSMILIGVNLGLADVAMISLENSRGTWSPAQSRQDKKSRPCPAGENSESQAHSCSYWP
jgi:hypothetical protein